MSRPGFRAVLLFLIALVMISPVSAGAQSSSDELMELAGWLPRGNYLFIGYLPMRIDKEKPAYSLFERMLSKSIDENPWPQALSKYVTASLVAHASRFKSLDEDDYKAITESDTSTQTTSLYPLGDTTLSFPDRSGATRTIRLRLSGPEFVTLRLDLPREALAAALRSGEIRPEGSEIDRLVVYRVLSTGSGEWKALFEPVAIMIIARTLDDLRRAHEAGTAAGLNFLDDPESVEIVRMFSGQPVSWGFERRGFFNRLNLEVARRNNATVEYLESLEKKQLGSWEGIVTRIFLDDEFRSESIYLYTDDETARKAFEQMARYASDAGDPLIRNTRELKGSQMITSTVYTEAYIKQLEEQRLAREKEQIPSTKKPKP